MQAPTNAAATGGSLTTVSGLSLWAADSSATAILSGAVCGTTSWTSGTGVTCLSPGGAGSLTALTVSTVVGTGVALFSYDGKRSVRCAAAQRGLPLIGAPRRLIALLVLQRPSSPRHRKLRPTQRQREAPRRRSLGSTSARDSIFSRQACPAPCAAPHRGRVVPASRA
jgi:hypothetical protein